jgi:hypothetical protein
MHEEMAHAVDAAPQLDGSGKLKLSNAITPALVVRDKEILQGWLELSNRWKEAAVDAGANRIEIAESRHLQAGDREMIQRFKDAYARLQGATPADDNIREGMEERRMKLFVPDSEKESLAALGTLLTTVSDALAVYDHRSFHELAERGDPTALHMEHYAKLSAAVNDFVSCDREGSAIALGLAATVLPPREVTDAHGTRLGNVTSAYQWGEDRIIAGLGPSFSRDESLHYLRELHQHQEAQALDRLAFRVSQTDHTLNGAEGRKATDQIEKSQGRHDT